MDSKIYEKRFDKEVGVWNEHYQKQKLNSLIELEVKRRTKFTLEFIKKIKKNNLKVLDIGCGSGNLLQKIKKLNTNIDITGIDISSEMVKTAQKNNNTKKIYQKNIEKESLNQKFDVITLMGVFPYFKNPKKTIKNIDNMLKPEGYIIFTYNNKISLSYKINRFFKNIASTSMGKHIIEFIRKYFLGRKNKLEKSTLTLRGYNIGEIRTLLKNYEIIKEEGLVYSPGLMGSLSVKTDKIWKKLLPKKSGYANIVFMRKNE
ncbi:MAG: class I SAM-dependent methyltransferase [Nanoarchaeota archaeon]